MQTSSHVFALLCLALFLHPRTATAGDSDGDGVDDHDDLTPCDAAITYLLYVPSAKAHGALLYEDNWPGYGDLDFNDAVVTYHYALGYTKKGRLRKLVATYNILASGNGRPNGLALAMPIPTANVGSIGLQIGGGPLLPLAPRSGETNLVVDILADTKSAFGAGPSGSLVNTDATSPILPGQPYKLTIVLASPIPLNAAGAPFDVFFFWTNEPSHEIHRPGFAGTSSMNQSLFGTLQDGSTASRHFVDDTGLPYVLDIPTIPKWLKETVRIDLGYPQIVNFAASAGAGNRNWYKAPIFPHLFTTGAGQALPPSPSFIGGTGAFTADTSCMSCSDAIQNQGEIGIDCGGPCSSCGTVP